MKAILSINGNQKTSDRAARGNKWPLSAMYQSSAYRQIWARQ